MEQSENGFADCPNCQTPWKCNGPHLLYMNNDIYQSIDGYYIRKNDKWKFTPVEKEFEDEELLSIAETLTHLNERNNDD